MKIKLKLPKYKFNKLGNLGVNHHLYMPSWTIKNLIQTQEDKANNYNVAGVRDDVLNPGAWTLHFDGQDFWFEGSKEIIEHNEMEAAE